jgi:hypothetical protein
MVTQGALDQQALRSHSHPAFAQQFAQSGHFGEASLIRVACL